VLAARGIIPDIETFRYVPVFSPHSVAELHAAMEYPDVVDPDGKFIRREDGRILINFGQHRGTPVDELAGTKPGFLEWMLKKDFSDEAKAIAIDALKRRRKEAAVPA
jgi:hypothetical protein